MFFVIPTVGVTNPLMVVTKSAAMRAKNVDFIMVLFDVIND